MYLVGPVIKKVILLVMVGRVLWKIRSHKTMVDIIQIGTPRLEA